MTPKLLFWCWALFNMALIVGFAVRGMRAIRANRVDAHRRAMTWAGGFVLTFLVAYLVKVALLGGEDVGAWSPAARANLYVHEGFVASMLVGGGFAFALGRKLAATRRVTGNAADPLPDRAVVARHGLAGRVAVICALLGFATACGILGGMLTRG